VICAAPCTQVLHPTVLGCFLRFLIPFFTKVTDADVDAIYAYLRTLEPVRYRPPGNSFLFNMRWHEVASFGNLKLPGVVWPAEAVDKMITTIDGLTLKDNEPPRAERRQGPIW
jgi:hypothetical protein